MELKGQLADITNACAATEKERDFYFDSELCRSTRSAGLEPAVSIRQKVDNRTP